MNGEGKGNIGLGKKKQGKPRLSKPTGWFVIDGGDAANGRQHGKKVNLAVCQPNCESGRGKCLQQGEVAKSVLVCRWGTGPEETYNERGEKAVSSIGTMR